MHLYKYNISELSFKSVKLTFFTVRRFKNHPAQRPRNIVQPFVYHMPGERFIFLVNLLGSFCLLFFNKEYNVLPSTYVKG